MLGLSTARQVPAARRTADPAGRDADTCDQYAASLYRQALLTLDHPGLAAQVVADVLVSECTHPEPPAADDDARIRLAVSVYRRCRDLTDRQRWLSPPPPRPPADLTGSMDAGALLSARDRGALGLVMFGGLGYLQASRELAISPRDLAVLLRAALRRLTIDGPVLG